ncbi:hypothetical protein Mgra_00005503 [Meloidogyne graminicola]
MLSHV